MDLKIRINGPNVSFNVICVIDIEEEEQLPATVEIPIDELFELDISNESIRHIPESIGRLRNLTSLSLVNDELVSIPNSIGSLRNLTQLVLAYNQLDSIPDSIRRLTNLDHLDLEGNRFTTFPTITSLTNLEDLNLSNNQITSIPRTIEDLTNLEDLNLSSNPIQHIPECIGHLNLLRLNLAYTQLTRIPATIGNSSLTRCILPNNIILDPLQEEYIFTNRTVFTEVRRVFDIRRYNELMEEKIENQNELDRRSARLYTKAATKYYATRPKTAKFRLFSNRKNIAHLKEFVNDIVIPELNPPSSKVLAKNKFRSHIMGMLGNRYIPKTIDEVIQLREGIRLR